MDSGKKNYIFVNISGGMKSKGRLILQARTICSFELIRFYRVGIFH